LSRRARSEVFLRQVRSAAGRSPLYDRLWRELAGEPAVDALVDEYRWDTPLRVAAGLHYLVLDGRANWDAAREAITAHADFLRRFVAEQRIQTNEVQRSWMLLPCFLAVARAAGVQTLDVVELGPSAGLNLVWDRYRYRYANGEWGPKDGLLELSGDERQPVPAHLLGSSPRVRSRVGVDLNPIDVTTDDGARLLKSFVWADQTWRLELLDRAIAALRRDPPELVRGDIVDELPRLLERRRPDALTLVFQTAVLSYVPRDGRERVRRALEQAAQSGMLAYVSTAQPAEEVHTYYGLFVQQWPDGRRRLVAHADFHGAWLEWRVAIGDYANVARTAR
jgi:hypothetical protein